MTAQGDISKAHPSATPYRPLIGITMGDPGGVGADLVVRALADSELRHQGRFIVFGLDEALAYAADQAEVVPFWFRRPHETVGRVESGVVVADFDEYDLFPTPVRQPTRQGGEASIRFLDEAVARARAGQLDAVLTLPTWSESWRLAGVRFRTSLDKLADALGTRRVRRMLVGGSLRVVLASDLEPLFGLWQRFGIGTVFQPIDLLHEALRTYFGIDHPKIAVCRLNPPAIHDRHFGDEEHRIIEPAILMAREAGIRVEGPLPASEVFSRYDGKTYDGAVAMYHDQGAVPVRMTSPDTVVAVTLGLPVVHIEPQVEPPFQSPGPDRPVAEPLKAAIRLAIEMIRTRVAAPLPTAASETASSTSDPR